ncbi:MAG: argininosuccinate lyase [Phycisphaerae bacterium]
MAKKSWEQRLSGKPSEIMANFVESLSIDNRLYKYDIAGSIAHAQMLAEQKLISKNEFVQIEQGLLKIAERIDQGKFKFDKNCEDIHMAIESALVKEIGEAGKKLHTGRSRNDQVATDIKLWLRDQIEIVKTKLILLEKRLVYTSSQYIKDVMPAYTHLQRAQPISIGAYLLSFVEQFERDFVRLSNCRNLLNVSPLGSGAVAGSTLDIDRRRTAYRLGFSSITRSSLDAVSDRDFAAEFIFDCALIGAHLSRMAEDLLIFSSNEFGFIKVSDSICTSSSMMPQKRNLDAMELIRGKCGTLYGSLVGILTILKAQPSGYNRDLQEDKVHIFAAADTIIACLEMAEEVIANIRFDVEKISEQLDDGYLDATALAEYLVTKGVAFRDAHGITGKLVAVCEKQNRKLSELSLEQLREYSQAFEDDVYGFLGSVNVAGNYISEGAAGIKQVNEQLEYYKRELAKR